jgi:hypothetical protein
MTDDTSLARSVGGFLSHVVPGLSHDTVRSFEEDAAQCGPLNRRPLGLRVVPLDRIVGSVGRARELRPDFLPRHGDWEKVGSRYRRVEHAVKRGEVLPPIELYKLGYNYYVLDGNHRVAAYKKVADNDGEVDAYVTLFLPVGDTEAARVYLERRAFEEATGLTQVGAVEHGHYPALLAEIEAYQAEVSAATGRDVPLKEAAGDWYITVWLPRAEQIRRANLRRHWPDKRTADIYLYIRAYQVEESARLGRPIDWETALRDFRTRFSTDRWRRLPNPRRLLRQISRLRPGLLHAGRASPGAAGTCRDSGA